ncbi:MAG TPA: SRPBCC domain-containing protein [Flavobacteriales bacterium]|nr:SRPBCC domain-containing protein [Flavobacteriales bacterium]
MATITNITKRQVSITRVINAPLELVFDAWTNVEHLSKWYAPDHCPIQYIKFEGVQGGTFLSCIYTPDGKECWCKGTFLEIVKNKRIIYILAVANQKGQNITAAEAGMDPEWPDETIVTVLFENEKGKTKVTLEQTVSEELAKKTGAYPGWNLMLNNLENLLAERK